MRAPRTIVSWKRLAVGGMSVAVLVLVAGFLSERIRFGSDPAETVNQVARDVERTLAFRARGLRRAAASLIADPQLVRGLSEEPPAARTLFSLLERASAVEAESDEAVTLYSADDQVVAWTGRASTLPAGRLNGPAALFVAPG